MPASVAPHGAAQKSPTPARVRPGTFRVLIGIAVMALALLAAASFWKAARTSPSPPAAARATAALAPPHPSAPPAAARATPAPERAPIAAASSIAPSAAELKALQERVISINRAQTEAVFAHSPEVSRLSDELIRSIADLGHGMYRYYVGSPGGDLAQARAEMEGFLRKVEWNGLGLSDDTIQNGVDAVQP